jgi:hypothetical protein
MLFRRLQTQILFDLRFRFHSETLCFCTNSNFSQDTLIHQRGNMAYGDLTGPNVLLLISKGLVTQIHSACYRHTFCSPCPSIHPTSHVLKKGSGARQRSGFLETHTSRASDCSHRRTYRTHLEYADLECTPLQNFPCSVQTGEESSPKWV